MFVFAPAPQAVVPVSGEKNVFFPVNRVYCVGRNYADHDKEMGGTGKTTPCFFAKPADAIFPIDAGKTAQVRFLSTPKTCSMKSNSWLPSASPARI